jgi:hypothetical protein
LLALEINAIGGTTFPEGNTNTMHPISEKFVPLSKFHHVANCEDYDEIICIFKR